MLSSRALGGSNCLHMLLLLLLLLVVVVLYAGNSDSDIHIHLQQHLNANGQGKNMFQHIHDLIITKDSGLKVHSYAVIYIIVIPFRLLSTKLPDPMHNLANASIAQLSKTALPEMCYAQVMSPL